MDEQFKMLEHEFYVKRAISRDLHRNQQEIQKRFDWSGNDYITKTQTTDQMAKIKMMERLNEMYHYENEDPFVPLVEEEKDLDSKQADKLRKEKESQIKSDRKIIMDNYRMMEVQRPEELTDDEVMAKLHLDGFTYEMVDDFSPEAVRDNFEECIKKLDEINRIASRLKVKPELKIVNINTEDGVEVSSIWYNFEEFAAVCKKEFDNSLAVNGLELINGVPTPISYEKSREASIMDTKVRREFINVFKKGEYMEEQQIIQNIVDDVVRQWSSKDYFEVMRAEAGVNEMEQLHSDVEKYCSEHSSAEQDVAQYLYEDYLFYFNSVLANRSALNTLLDGMDNPKDNCYFSMLDFDYTVHVEDKIKELTDYIEKTDKEMQRIRQILDTKLKGGDISLKQRFYLAEYYFVRDEELERIYSEKVNKYKTIKKEYSSKSLEDAELAFDSNMAKIDELCSKLKSDTSIDDLIDMSEELFKVSEVIERRDEIFFETPLLSLKSQKILTFAKKARAALLYRTSGLSDVAEKSLTDGEREYIRKNYGGVYAENIVKYAGMLYAEADVTYNNARRQFINRPEAWENLNEYRFVVQLSQRRLHKNTEQEIAEIKNKYDCTDSLYRDWYFRLIYASRISGVTENRQNEAGHIQTIVRLTKDNYSVFGETETIPLNLDSLEKLPYIEDMRDEEYADLLAKLRAGTFYEERFTLDKEHFQPNGELKEEYVQQFKAQNFAGLLIIKNKMREYIDGLYDKYGLEMPRLETIAENPYEIVKDFAHCRECYKYIDSKAMFDNTNDQDMLLKNKIKFYCEMIKCFDKAIEIYNSEDFYMGKIEAETRKIYDDGMKKPADYIRKYKKMIQM